MDSPQAGPTGHAVPRSLQRRRRTRDREAGQRGLSVRRLCPLPHETSRGVSEPPRQTRHLRRRTHHEREEGPRLVKVEDVRIRRHPKWRNRTRRPPDPGHRARRPEQSPDRDWVLVRPALTGTGVRRGSRRDAAGGARDKARWLSSARSGLGRLWSPRWLLGGSTRPVGCGRRVPARHRSRRNRDRARRGITEPPRMCGGQSPTAASASRSSSRRRQLRAAAHGQRS